MNGGVSMDIKEELKEVSANLYLVKKGAQEEDNKEIIDRALFAIIRSVDRIVEEIDENPAFTDRL
jgi:hypothetical protein